MAQETTYRYGPLERGGVMLGLRVPQLIGFVVAGMIGAQSGVSKSLADPGSTWFGSPAKEHRRALRIEGAIRQLPELVDDVRAIKRELGREEGSAPPPPRTPPPSEDGARA